MRMFVYLTGLAGNKHWLVQHPAFNVHRKKRVDLVLDHGFLFWYHVSHFLVPPITWHLGLLTLKLQQKKEESIYFYRLFLSIAT